MAKLRMEIEVEYNDTLMHGGDDDSEAKAWFLSNIVGPGSGGLWLHSNELGEAVGAVEVLRCEPDSNVCLPSDIPPTDPINPHP